MAFELLPAYKATRAAETIDNYTRADQTEITNRDLVQRLKPNHSYFPYYDDRQFWSAIFNKELVSGQLVCSKGGVISEWIARIPGLYWMPESAAMRRVSKNIIETIGNIHALPPISKSQVVIGGVGTLRLESNTEGYRLVSYSTSRNASTGVPMLIAPEVWDYYNIQEGTEFEFEAVWTELPKGWSDYFPSTADIPRGCIIIRDKKALSDIQHHNATQIHPFSILEYMNDQTGETYHDFIFVSALTNEPYYREQITDFFNSYATANGRIGEYLTQADLTQSLWEASFKTPQDLLQKNDLAKSQLDVLLARIKGPIAKGQTIDAINRALLNEYDTVGLKRLASQYLKIHKSLLLDNLSMSNLTISFLDLCLERNCLDALVDAIVKEKPHLIIQ